MQADQTVLSLRPGGGGNRGRTSTAPRFDFGSSDLRPNSAAAAFKTNDSRFELRERVRYTRDQLLQLRAVVDIPEEILKVKQEVETEFFGETQSWTKSEGTVPAQPQARFTEPDTRDWRGRAPPPVEERSWDAGRDNRDFNRGRTSTAPRFDFGSSDLRPNSAAAAFKTNDSRFELRERVRYTRDQLLQLRAVVDIPEEILKVKQEVETEFFGETQSWTKSEGTVPAQPQARFTEPDTRDWRGRAPPPVEERSWDAGRDNRDFNRFDNRQEPNSQYGRGQAANQGTGGPAPALVKAEELLGTDGKVCPEEENVEAICHFFNTIGKQLDEGPKSKRINDLYFSRLKELSNNQQLAPRMRFMVRDVIDLRSNNWIPRREEVKAKTITEIHTEAEKNMGLRRGSTASIRNSRALAAGAPGSLSPVGLNRPGTGGMMPGMPGNRMMPGAPAIENDDWEYPRSRSMPRGVQPPLLGKTPSPSQKFLPQGSGGFISGKPSALLQGSGGPAANPASVPVSRPVPTPSPVAPVAAAPVKVKNPAELKRKTISLLEEYFSVLILDEALQCVEELRAPEYHAELVKEAVSLALEKIPPRVEPLTKLLNYLLSKKVLTRADLVSGCISYGSLLDDIAIDLPKAPSNFGEILGHLVVSGGLDFKVVNDVLKKMEDDYFQKAVFAGVKNVVGSSGKGILESQAADVAACESLF
ncbi:MIF4G domain-containing protein / MA3 domain-containing protein [Artemisia annua]|uniref:MIF4G domain-containing protein / MA3 domain-containing protein n=1 Tax=Artemisia annua TaxID=35608 RepID=A0A2U1QDT8_ARTAN|nr:MIF4G domain-containing protein / MA3 domain-containing protein [Artemisia annua]